MKLDLSLTRYYLMWVCHKLQMGLIMSLDVYVQQRRVELEAVEFKICIHYLSFCIIHLTYFAVTDLNVVMNVYK